MCELCVIHHWRQNIPPWIYHRVSILWIKDISPRRYLHCRTHWRSFDTLWRREWDGVSRQRPSSSDADDGKPTRAVDGTIAAKPNAAISAETIMWFSHRTRAEFSARTTLFDVLLIIYPTFPPRYIASFFFLSFSYLLHALLPTTIHACTFKLVIIFHLLVVS